MGRSSAFPGLATLALLGAVTTLPLSAQDEVMRSAYHDYRVVTVADGLENPWGMAFLPGGDMLVTERPGRLRIVRDGRLPRAERVLEGVEERDDQVRFALVPPGVERHGEGGRG